MIFCKLPHLSLIADFLQVICKTQDKCFGSSVITISSNLGGLKSVLFKSVLNLLLYHSYVFSNIL